MSNEKKEYSRDDCDEIIRENESLKKEKALLSSFRHILDKAYSEVYTFDAETYKFIHLNDSALENIGYSLSEIQELTALDIKPKMEEDVFKETLNELKDGEKEISIFETVHLRKNGTTYPAEIRLQYLQTNESAFYVAIVQDVSERKKAESENKLYSMVINQISDWIVITDKDGVIQYVNKEVERVTGYSEKELLGEKPSIWSSGKYSPSFYKNMWQTITSGSSIRNIMVNRRKNTDFFYSDQTITPIKNDEGDIIKFVSTGKDITASKLLEDRLNHIAHHDALTNLPNRSALQASINKMISSEEGQEQMHAVLIVDINHFVLVNDTFGSEMGDIVLKRLAERLLAAVDKKDVIGRVGGDKFAIILSDVQSINDIAVFADKIMKPIIHPFKIHEQAIILSGNIGISVYPTDGTDTKELLSKAESALSKAKKGDKNGHAFYTADMTANATAYLFMQQNLFKALNKEEFVVYYQPYFDIHTKKLAGMESLVRWDSGDFGLVPPGKFIPILEETGLIKEVGREIVRMVAFQQNSWREEGYPLVPVSVNLSPIQFKEENLLEILHALIMSYELNSDYFVFEITESTFMENVDFTNAFLNKMKELGFGISIDDFGTGYSSLSYLKRFPLDNLKIDISFVREITTDPDDAAIVSAIVSMAHSLGLKTIAEGVETTQQLEILRNLNCDYVQGYLWGRPEPAAAIEAAHFKKE